MRDRVEILSALDDASKGLDTTVFEKTAMFIRVITGLDRDTLENVLLIDVTHKPTGMKVTRIVHRSDLDLCASLRGLLVWEIEVIMNAFREKGVVV